MRRLLYAVVVLASVASAREVPYLSGRVVDEARVLDAASSQTLETLLKDHETRTGNQVAVLTVSSLGGETVEDFAHKVFRTWGLGRKDKNDGVLIVVAPTEHKARIEVGYGLEGTLPDIVAGRIVRDAMIPHFRGNDFRQGLLHGAREIVAVLGGAPVAAPSPPSRPARRPRIDWTEAWMSLATLFCVLFIVLDSVRITGGALHGYFTGCVLIAWCAWELSLDFGETVAWCVFLLHVIGFPLLNNYIMTNDSLAWLRRKPRKSHGFGGGWSSGGGWSDGGGFSGGGGDSGGGGASGSW